MDKSTQKEGVRGEESIDTRTILPEPTRALSSAHPVQGVIQNTRRQPLTTGAMAPSLKLRNAQLLHVSLEYVLKEVVGKRKLKVGAKQSEIRLSKSPWC